MRQLKLPFKTNYEQKAREIFDKMLAITPTNPSGYDVKHLANWLEENEGEFTAYVNRRGMIHSKHIGG